MISFISERARMVLADLSAALWRERIPLAPLGFSRAPQNAAEAFALPDGEWTDAPVGFTVTGAEEAVWLQGAYAVPFAWAGERVALWLDLPGMEPLLYLDGDGDAPYQALDYNHQDVLLHDPAEGGETRRFAIECYAPTRGGTLTVRAADLCRVDRAAYALYYDFHVAVGLLETLDENSREGQALLVALEDAVNALDYTSGVASSAFYNSLPACSTAFYNGFFALFKGTVADEHDPALVCAGHSHIDLAYLWALANTKKKVGRTFATALRLMDEYPDYHFSQSQPQLYEYAKTHYPELYEAVKDHVAEGRWEPTGAMWVEADCNVTGGESLIRQILIGNRFYKNEFGKATRVLWLPDTFGFPASLPQIIAGCGLQGLLTTKLSWSQFNAFPHDTFKWRGIDGTETLTHFVTTPDVHAQLKRKYATYNGQMTPAQAKGAWDDYRQKSVNSELLNLFGWGDGGGGPTRLHLETARLLASVGGVPACRMGAAEDYFERLRARVWDNRRTPVWGGELYLENHRGTYTSQGRIKRANRKNEILYRNAEIFGALAQVATGAPFDHDALADGWKKLLVNQFHDILPGTCVGEAVAEAMRDYANAQTIGETALDAALNAVASKVKTRGDAVVVFNPTDTLRPAEAVRVTIPRTVFKAVEFADAQDAPIPSQLLSVSRDGAREYLVTLLEVGPMGYQTINVGKAGGAAEDASNLTVEARLLENEFVRVRFDDRGEIVSLVHKIYDEDDADADPALRETAAPGQTLNALVLYEDRPYAYDGWNVDAYYEQKPYPLREIATVESIEIIERGPVRAGLEIKRRFLSSTITQRVYLYAHSPRVEFETSVDWQERQMLLKAEFPVAVNATRATYEIQWGHIERATHRNTSWDEARFEVCAHKWADLSEGDWGVSLLNDSKYGHDCHDNVLRLTLLKGGIRPDPDADRGAHTFTYAVLPHTGDFRGETIDEAHALNYPLLSRFISPNPKGTLPPNYTLTSVDDQGVIIETIKPSEDDPDLLVIRLYDAFNSRGHATLTLGFDIAEAWTCNLVEENREPVPHDGHAISFDYRPFEIKTFLLRPATV